MFSGCVAILVAATARPEEALVAVAANFAEALQHLEADFEAASEHRITSVSGSTGKLYAQITSGAPYDVLLAADQVRPARLENEGWIVNGSRFTYALGAIALWSADPQRIGADGAAVLRAADFRRLAIANPALAPYGKAAVQALTALDVYDAVSERIVMGENIGQTHVLVATGNAELGIVAQSYVSSQRNKSAGSRWNIAPELHDPIRQDAVLLKRATKNTAAREFLVFLRSDANRNRIRVRGAAPRNSTLGVIYPISIRIANKPSTLNASGGFPKTIWRFDLKIGWFWTCAIRRFQTK